MMTKDELTAVFQEMLAEFVPSERAPREKQFIQRKFECKDPEARGARCTQQISAELILNAVCPRFMADSITTQGIEPCDICEIIVQMWRFDALLDDDGTEIEPEHWMPAFSVDFRPTNGWTP